jgi:hypothetical protein
MTQQQPTANRLFPAAPTETVRPSIQWIANSFPDLMAETERLQIKAGLSEIAEQQEIAAAHSAPALIQAQDKAHRAYAAAPTAENRAALDEAMRFDPYDGMGLFRASTIQLEAQRRIPTIAKAKLAPVIIAVLERAIARLIKTADDLAATETETYLRFGISEPSPSALLSGLREMVASFQREMVGASATGGWPLPALIRLLAQ